jgi:hypothetical protein
MAVLPSRLRPSPGRGRAALREGQAGACPYFLPEGPPGSPALEPGPQGRRRRRCAAGLTPEERPRTSRGASPGQPPVPVMSGGEAPTFFPSGLDREEPFSEARSRDCRAILRLSIVDMSTCRLRFHYLDRKPQRRRESRLLKSATSLQRTCLRSADTRREATSWTLQERSRVSAIGANWSSKLVTLSRRLTVRRSLGCTPNESSH